ncbi:MAG: nucleoside phosphorylase [Thermodesulfobacteriota bacterium]|nr:nucleoside phosphorylase [Thermodesulfobacteriota bacterium]
MKECIINPERGKNDPQLPAGGFLLINPAEAHTAAQFANAQAGQRSFLYHSSLFVINQPEASFFLAGPAVGAPMAVMTLEKLIALGAAKVVVLGWCGSLSQSLHVGDILLPTWAVSEEGTSNHYPLQDKPHSSENLRTQLKTILWSEFQVQEGPIWTTDAPYRETRAKVTKYGDRGILGVDMEFAALNTVAAFRGVEVAGAMLISDELYQPEWRPGFLSKSFRKQSRKFFQLLVDNFF